ncbi:MAG: hypothetical protein VX910_04930 [Candidatus Latescibacterota bacterium]|nr:hypothetical protein [Candidatus Latescibacterota bacterium]
MDETTLEIGPPRRAFLFIFLITGIVLLLNGVAVLFLSAVPRSPNAIQPGSLSPSFGAGGAMPIVAGFLCLAGAGWMLNRHRKITRIADLVQAALPEAGTTEARRKELYTALLERADQLRSALVPFPEACISIKLSLGDTYHLSLELTSSNTMTGRLSPTSDRLAKDVEAHVECVALEDEILLDLGTTTNVPRFLDILGNEIVRLPPDYELAGDIHISKRERSIQN